MNIIKKEDNNLGVYIGARGEKFKDFLISILRRGNLKKRYLKILTDEESMKVYSSAFTSELVDPVNNYQVLEQVGDLTGNKFIVSYMYNKFPQLKCTEGVKVVARLRINYGAKQSFSEIARKLGFWEFISTTNDLRQRKMKPLLEDVFEAFLGATETILDNRKRIGVGYAIVYDILSNIFDEIDISLKYEDLYDAKTRLKELFDTYESVLGPLSYREIKKEMITYSKVYRVDGGQYQVRKDQTINKKRIIGGSYILIGEGSAALKSDAQQQAARSALYNLRSQGWCKPAPEIYRRFSNGVSTTEENIDKKTITDKWGEDLNLLQSTKEKTKYQTKYQSTPLSYYCRKRNLKGVKVCINMGCRVDIADTEGMYPLDLLLIGSVDEDKVFKIFRWLYRGSKSDIGVKMNKSIYNMYFCNKYVSECFDEYTNKITLV
jgi:dsRNA-specific ribonuclease